jgi:hypothetical protein
VWCYLGVVWGETDIKADVVEEVSMVTSIQSSGSTVSGGCC